MASIINPAVTVFVCLCVCRWGCKYLCPNFREKMVAKEMVLQVVLVFRYMLIVVNACEVRHILLHLHWYILNIYVFFRVILGPVETLVSR